MCPYAETYLHGFAATHRFHMGICMNIYQCTVYISMYDYICAQCAYIVHRPYVCIYMLKIEIYDSIIQLKSEGIEYEYVPLYGRHIAQSMVIVHFVMKLVLHNPHVKLLLYALLIANYFTVKDLN